MIDYWCPDQTNEQTTGATEIYELLLTLGAAMSVGRTTVAVLLSPQNSGTTGEHLAPGDVLDERSHEYGMTWDFLNAADRINVREKVNSEKP